MKKSTIRRIYLFASVCFLIAGLLYTFVSKDTSMAILYFCLCCCFFILGISQKSDDDDK